MVEVTVDGNDTVREEHEILNKFRETKTYDYLQMQKSDPSFNDQQEIIEDWLIENYPCKNEKHAYDLKWYLFTRV